MNLFQNNLIRLQKETDTAISDISNLDNKEELSRITHYLSSSSLPIFQIEVIRKDLAGLALEADAEHLTLREKLGIDTKDFCDEIIKSSETHPAKKERFFQDIVILFQYMACFYIGEYVLFNSAPAVWGISGSVLSCSLICFFAARILTNYTRNKLSLHPSIIVRNLYRTVTVAGFIFYAIIGGIFFRNSNVFLIQGNGWFIFSILLFTAIAATLAMNLYFNRCSDKYSY